MGVQNVFTSVVAYTFRSRNALDIAWKEHNIYCILQFVKKIGQKTMRPVDMSSSLNSFRSFLVRVIQGITTIDESC